MFLELVGGTYIWKVGRTRHPLETERNKRDVETETFKEVGWADLIHGRLSIKVK